MAKIITSPNSILTSPTKPVGKIDKSIKKLVAEMEKTLVAQVDPQGVGLAATQVGVAVSLFIMKAGKKDKTEVCINPKILRSVTGGAGGRAPDSAQRSFGEHWREGNPQQDPSRNRKKNKKQPLEGCLSVPYVWSPVARAQKVLVEYLDLTGAIHKKWFSGLKAVIVQHEVDHLNGIIFTQRALEQNALLYEEKDGKLKKMNY